MLNDTQLVGGGIHKKTSAFIFQSILAFSFYNPFYFVFQPKNLFFPVGSLQAHQICVFSLQMRNPKASEVAVTHTATRGKESWALPTSLSSAPTPTPGGRPDSMASLTVPTSPQLLNAPFSFAV